MAKLLERIKSMFNDERRHVDHSVKQERRVPKTLKDADEHLRDVVDYQED